MTARCARRALALLVVLIASGMSAGTAGAATQYPVIYSTAMAFTGYDANAAPPGANLPSCQLSAAHPRPVVLVHGTFANQNDNWRTVSPLLANNGYCVYTFNYGGPPALGSIYAINDIATSAQQLATFVNQVLALTGAAKVDLVGHSQGGMMPRYYLKYLGGATKVHTLVALAPSNHGTDLGGFTALANYIPGVSTLVNEGLANVCEACVQQETGSAFITNLNAGGETVPGVSYTVITSKYDEVVTPYASQFLTGSNVHNLLLQDQCSIDFSGHLGVAFDHIALRDVLNALDPAHAQSPVCTFIGFETGG